MTRNSYADYIKHWGELTSAIEASPALAFLEPQRTALETELQALIEANLRQALLKSQAQEATRELEDCAKRGADLATRLRDSVRGYYGRTGEQLVGFRIQPRRPKSAAKEAPPPAPENGKPSGMGPNPARTAAPETDASTQD